MGVIGLAAACGHFHHDRERNLARVATIIGHARDAGAQLLVLPHATLGGYVGEEPVTTWTDALPAHDPVFDQIARLARELVVCLGYLEVDGDRFHSSAVCLAGDGVLGRHREVHPAPRPGSAPSGAPTVSAGDRLRAFDTPVGRLGLLVDHDKAFPEAARCLAMDGAVLLAALAAWPASVPRRAATLVHDPQSRLFDLYDQARAAENQVVVVSSNQSGGTGRQRFVGSAKIVGPHGEVLAGTGARGGLAVAALDVAHEVAQARAGWSQLAGRRPDVYNAAAGGAG